MRTVFVVLAALLAACCGASSEDGLALAVETSDAESPCGVDLAQVDDGQIEPPLIISNTEHPGLMAYVFDGLDDIGALTVQKFFFASCGGVGVIDEPRVLLGDIAWQEATSASTTKFGTVAAKQPPRVVVMTMELACAGDSCPVSEELYELLSAFAYTIAGAP